MSWRNKLSLKKQQLIEELKYVERRMEEAKLHELKQIKNEESSDSDTDLPPLKFESSTTYLKAEYLALQTCFEATQELNDLHILQSEVNILVEDPEYDGEPLVTEDGIWREVTVECRVDLVPFSMTFYVHRPSKRFGGPSYRGLKVSVLKELLKVELDMSILHELRRPSEAYEVLKEYSRAHRSRRTTLAHLSSMYSSKIHMSPLADGGYQMKCGNLLEISWTLHNKSSPVAPFHHRMKLELEYMEQAHIESVKAAHKALSAPTTDTNQRTSLLSKIITVCLEAQGIHPAETTPESEATPSNSELPTKSMREEEAMAPPKAPPKKSRTKGKENKGENVSNGKSRDNKKKVNLEKDKKKPDGAVENKAKNSHGQGAKHIGDNTYKDPNTETVKVRSKEGNIDRVKKDSKVKEKIIHDNQREKDNGVRDNDVKNVKKLKLKENKGSNEVVASKII